MTKVTWVAAFAVGAAFALSGCGGDSPETPVGADDTPAAPAPADDGEVAATGTIDCSQIDGALLADYSVYIQMLAQLKSPESLEGFAALGFTTEKLQVALDNLEPVRAAGTTPFGDAGAALDYYNELNAAMAEVVAKGDAVTQADIDAYNAVAGKPEDVIYNQLAINGPLSEQCPDLEG